MMDMSVQSFLDSVQNPSTKKGYKFGIRKFCEWYGKSAEEILKLRQDDLTQRKGEGLVEFKNRATTIERKVEQFHSYLLDQKYSINTARSTVGSVCQLFRFYEMPIRIRNGSKVSQTVKTNKNFPLAIEHVRAMYQVAALRERAILSLATDLGLRIGDFIQFRVSELPVLSQEPPIPFDVMTSKEKVVAHGFLSAETVDLLKLYLPTLEQRTDKKGKKRDNPYLFPSNGKSHISDEWVNRLLQDLAAKSGISLGDKELTFHCFRKMFLSASIDSGIGLTAGKKLCGKAVAESDDTYLTTVHLKEKFIQLKRFLSINEAPKAEVEKVEALKAAVNKLQEELTQQKLITDTISERNVEQQKRIEDIENEQKKLLEKMEKLLEDLS